MALREKNFRHINRENKEQVFFHQKFWETIAFQTFVRKISKNNGIIRLDQIFNLGTIKRNLKYLTGNIIKKPYKKYVFRINIS